MPNGRAERPRLSLSLSKRSPTRSEASSNPAGVDPDLLPYHQRSSGNLIAHAEMPTDRSARFPTASGMKPALSTAPTSDTCLASTHLSSSDNEHYGGQTGSNRRFSLDMLSPAERATMLKDSSENAAVLQGKSEHAAVLKDNSEKSGTQFSKSRPSRPRRSRLFSCFRARDLGDDDDAPRQDSAGHVRRMPWATKWAISKRASKTSVQAAAEITAEISSQSDSPMTPNNPTVRKQPRRALTKDGALHVLSDYVGGMRKRNDLKRDRRMWLEIAELPPGAALSEPPQPLCEGSQVAPHRGGGGEGGEAPRIIVHVGSHVARPDLSPIPCAHLARLR